MIEATMLKSLSSAGYNQWTQPSYEVKVRGKTTNPKDVMTLWGSAGIQTNLVFEKPLLLHIHNDLFGDPITFGTQKASGTQETIGTLKPGESVSIPLNSISAVFATCEQESTVCCLIEVQ
jgi:hypothetical protein